MKGVKLKLVASQLIDCAVYNKIYYPCVLITNALHSCVGKGQFKHFLSVSYNVVAPPPLTLSKHTPAWAHAPLTF